MSLVELKGVSLAAYEGRPALDGLTLALDRGDHLLFDGADDAVKTEILKLFAGAAEPDAGRVLREANIVSAMVFGSGGLLANQSLVDNVALPLRFAPAGAVLTAPEYLGDAHLAAAGYFVELEHPEAGRTTWDGSPVRFDGDRGHSEWCPAPCLGADNRTLLTELLGLTLTEVEALYATGVLAESPPVAG